MMRSIYNGVAGVKTHGYGMDIVANNIANVNTAGFRAAMAEFKDVFYQNSVSAGTNLGANQIGLAATGVSSAFSQQQGILTPTDRPLDIAIEGRGFFGIKDADGLRYFTRNGDFGLDANAMLTDRFGRYVLGTMNEEFAAASMPERLAKSYGVNNRDGFTIGSQLDISPADEDRQTPIKLPPNLYSEPEPSTYISLRGNLDASVKNRRVETDISNELLSSQISEDGANQILSAIEQEPGSTVIFSYKRNGNTVRASAVADENGTTQFRLKPPFASEDFSAINSKEVPMGAENIFRHKIIGKDGLKHDVVFNFSFKENLEGGGMVYNAKAQIFSADGKESSEHTGELRFNSDGSLAGCDIEQIDGVKLDFGDAVDKKQTNSMGGFSGLTSIDSQDLANKAVESDGRVGGILKSYSVDERGNIIAGFTNGKNAAIAKIAVFNFINEQGLAKNGENEFAQTADSGAAMFYRDANGRVFLPAKLKGNFLEQSNVQLSTELTQIIAYQRAYEASAKSITTADQMLKRAIELKK